MRANFVSYFFSLPSSEALEKNKFLRLFLSWFLCFLILIRALVLAHFLAELDYTEINPVKLTQYIFAQIAVLVFVLYLTSVVWRRPHKSALLSLLAICILSVIRSQDIVSVISAAVVFGCVFFLYRGLHFAASTQAVETVTSPE